MEVVHLTAEGPIGEHKNLEEYLLARRDWFAGELARQKADREGYPTMTDYQERLRRGENPFVAPRVRKTGGGTEPLYQFKFGLVLYTAYPPGPKRAGAVFDLYEALYPNRIRRYVPTVPGSIPDKWTPAVAREFRTRWLPDLRQRAVWGYGFDDGRDEDAYLFMFHGFRPVTEKGMASFFRFEFPWNVDQGEVRRLAADVARLVPFENGFGGYFLKPAHHPGGEL